MSEHKTQITLSSEDMTRIGSVLQEFCYENSNDTGFVFHDEAIGRLREALVPAVEPVVENARRSFRDGGDDAGAEAETDQIVKGIIDAIINQFLGTAERQPPRQPPYRVRVMDGMGQEELGKGVYVGKVPVYIYQTPNGIASSSFAEEPPDGVDPSLVQRIPDNPKIILDNGRVVYGCQVWWEPIDEELVQ